MTAARGAQNLYSLAPGGMAVAQPWLTWTWDSVLAACAAGARRPAAGHEETP
jgi:hypothetical protein